MPLSTQVSDDAGKAVIVHEMSETVADAYSAETFEDSLHVIALQARLMIGAHQSAVSYLPDSNFHAAIHTTSFSTKYEEYNTYDVMPTGEGIWVAVVDTNLAVRMTQEELVAGPLWKNFSNMKDKRGLEHPPMRGWLAVPIVRQNGEFIGFLQLTDKYEGDFTQQDQHELTHLAGLVGPTFGRRESLKRFTQPRLVEQA